MNTLLGEGSLRCGCRIKPALQQSGVDLRSVEGEDLVVMEAPVGKAADQQAVIGIVLLLSPVQLIRCAGPYRK